MENPNFVTGIENFQHQDLHGPPLSALEIFAKDILSKNQWGDFHLPLNCNGLTLGPIAFSQLNTPYRIAGVGRGVCATKRGVCAGKKSHNEGHNCAIKALSILDWGLHSVG